MRTRWLALALPLALPLAGCFGTHDTADGGADARVVVDARPTPPDGYLPPDAGPMCRTATISTLRMPRVLYDDQPLVVTVRAPSDGGCGCEPSLGALDPGDARIAPVLCDCCDMCDCIDPGYEVSAVGPRWPVGAHTLAAGAEPRPLLVTTRDRTRPLEPTGLRVEVPSDAVRSAGPTVHWAVISTSITVCCAEPVAAVDEGIGPAGELVLTLGNAVQEDCACVGDPHPLEVWWPLVDLPSGERVVRAGSFETTVRVP